MGVVRSLPGRRFHDGATALLLALATVLHALPAFRLPVATLDEIIMLDYPDVVNRGATPNADFYTAYGPLGYEFLGAWYRVLGYSASSERLAGLLYHVVVVLGVWTLSRRFGRGLAIPAGLLAIVFMPNDLTAFAWLGGMGLAVWALALSRSESGRGAWVAGGALAGLAVGWRYEMALVAGLPLLVLVWNHRRARFVILGGVAGSLPTALHLLDVGRAAWDNVSARMGVNFQLEVASVPVHVHLGMVGGLVALLGLAARAVVLRNREDWAWTLLCLSVVPQALQRIDVYHFGFAAVVVYPLAVVSGLDLVRRWEGRLRGRLLKPAIAGLLSVPALFLLGGLAAASTHVETQLVSNGSRAINVPADRANEIKAVIRDLRHIVPPGSAIFLGTDQMGRTSYNSYPMYYLLSDRYRFDSYYLELAAGVAERDGSGLSDDILRADALVISEFDPDVGDRLFPFAPKGFTDNQDTLVEHFELVRRHGSLMIYVRRG